MRKPEALHVLEYNPRRVVSITYGYREPCFSRRLFCCNRNVDMANAFIFCDKHAANRYFSTSNTIFVYIYNIRKTVKFSEL